jgi:hypothetical protein
MNGWRDLSRRQTMRALREAVTSLSFQLIRWENGNTSPLLPWHMEWVYRRLTDFDCNCTTLALYKRSYSVPLERDDETKRTLATLSSATNLSRNSAQCCQWPIYTHFYNFSKLKKSKE